MKYLLFSFMTFCLAMCSSETNRDIAATGDSAMPMETTQELNSIDQSKSKKTDNNSLKESTPEKIIKDAKLQIEVDNLNSAKNQIDQILSKFEAYYENENSYSNNYSASSDLLIRVPNHHFEGLMKAIELGNGKITSKNVSAKNVTEEYIDISMRLDNSRKYLAQYNVLLKKAKTIKEMLEIQEKIRRLEEEIEARTGRLKYIDNQVGLSTIRINLSEKYSTVSKVEGFGSRLVKALSDGLDLLKGTIIFFATLWPYILIFSLIFFFRKKISLPWKKKK